VAFSPNSSQLAAGSCTTRLGAGAIKIWDVKTGEEELTIEQFTLSVWSLAFSPDGTWLAAGRGSYQSRDPVGEVKVWWADTGWELATLPADSPCVWRVAFSPDGRRLAAACGDHSPHLGKTSSLVKIWDLETRLDIVHFSAGPHRKSTFRGADFSPDGHTLVSGRTDGTLQLWGRKTATWNAGSTEKK
jgi:WD40 repeat protein